jgi:hypothetical protein
VVRRRAEGAIGGGDARDEGGVMDAPENAGNALAEDYDALQMEAAHIVDEWQRLTADDQRTVRTFAPDLVRRVEEMRDAGRAEWWLDALATEVTL